MEILQLQFNGIAQSATGPLALPAFTLVLMTLAVSMVLSTWASLAALLASDAGKHITGQIVAVDGGVSAVIAT